MTVHNSSGSARFASSDDCRSSSRVRRRSQRTRHAGHAAAVLPALPGQLRSLATHLAQRVLVADPTDPNADVGLDDLAPAACLGGRLEVGEELGAPGNVHDAGISASTRHV